MTLRIMSSLYLSMILDYFNQSAFFSLSNASIKLHPEYFEGSMSNINDSVKKNH